MVEKAAKCSDLLKGDTMTEQKPKKSTTLIVQNGVMGGKASFPPKPDKKEEKQDGKK